MMSTAKKHEEKNTVRHSVDYPDITQISHLNKNTLDRTALNKETLEVRSHIVLIQVLFLFACVFLFVYFSVNIRNLHQENDS